MIRPKSLSFSLESPEETTVVAQKIAPLIVAGESLLLSGDLGAGKTHFARAFIQARLAVAGLAEDVPSPTYTLVQTYWDGICDIWHADLYRLTGQSDIYELGLTDAFQQSICLIEWPDRLGELRPQKSLRFEFSHTGSENTRALRITWGEPNWQGLVKALENHNV